MGLGAKRTRGAAIISLAEREGFEPSEGFKPFNGLANRPVKPLRHLSVHCVTRESSDCSASHDGVNQNADVAEGEGFEPSSPCGLPVFKTGAINHSAIPPRGPGETLRRGVILARWCRGQGIGGGGKAAPGPGSRPGRARKEDQVVGQISTSWCSSEVKSTEVQVPSTTIVATW